MVAALLRVALTGVARADFAGPAYVLWAASASGTGRHVVAILPRPAAESRLLTRSGPIEDLNQI
jgi:hypothetical protein